MSQNKYKQRVANRLADRPKAARPIQPWWITRWNSSRPNPVLHGPWVLLHDRKERELPEFEPDASDQV